MPVAVEDIWNTALRRINYPTPIGFAFEGSRASRVAVEVYGQTRDTLIESKDWRFARQEVALTLLKTAPVGGYGPFNPWTNQYPLLPWVYEYGYPENCLKLRSVRQTPIIMPDYDPVPSIFDVANDPSLNPPAKVVLTNIPAAIASFTASVNDPQQWASEAQFIEALIEALALRFQEALNPQEDAVKDRAAEAQVGQAQAMENRG